MASAPVESEFTEWIRGNCTNFFPAGMVTIVYFPGCPLCVSAKETLGRVEQLRHRINIHYVEADTKADNLICKMAMFARTRCSEETKWYTIGSAKKMTCPFVFCNVRDTPKSIYCSDNSNIEKFIKTIVAKEPTFNVPQPYCVRIGMPTHTASTDRSVYELFAKTTKICERFGYSLCTTTDQNGFGIQRETSTQLSFDQDEYAAMRITFPYGEQVWFTRQSDSKWALVSAQPANTNPKIVNKRDYEWR